MLTKEIKRAAQRLRLLRSETAGAEVTLASALREGLGHGVAKELSDALDVSETYLSDIRNGKRSIGDATLEKLCEVE
jgi:transcriptional regulator with XRE-family HTH domain